MDGGLEIAKVTVLGAGGNVGVAIISELLKHDFSFEITAVTRQASSYTPLDVSVVHKTVDYASSSSLIEVLAGQDAVVNCVTGSATTYAASKLIVDAAVAAHVKLFFANEFVGNLGSEQFQRMPETFVGAKVRIREYLEALGEAGKMRWTSLNGGPFFDMWLMKGPAGFDVKNRQARIYGTGANPLCWTPLTTIARAAVHMLRFPAPIINRAVYVCPFRKGELTQNAILNALESVLGTKFEVSRVDVEKINRNARIALDRGEVAKAMKGLTISNQFYEEDSGSDFSHLVDNETVGVEMMSVEDAVRSAMERYAEGHEVVKGMYLVEACEI